MAEHEEKHEEGGGGGHGHGGGGHGPGHGGGHEEEGGAPEWLISFADNVALMMGFFVILLAMNLGPKGNPSAIGDDPNAVGGAAPSAAMMDFAIAMREAFNNPVDLNSTDPGERLLVKRIIARASESEARDRGRAGREHDVKSIRPGDQFARGGNVPFERDSARLTPAARKSIDELLPILKGHAHIIELKGNVSAAEAFSLPDRGMNLSFQRSRAVAEALNADGIPWTQLRLTACADGDRVEPTTYSESGHRANQRVDVTVTDAGIPEYVKPGDGDGAADAGGEGE